jgi:hypothetical protein
MTLTGVVFGFFGVSGVDFGGSVKMGTRSGVGLPTADVTSSTGFHNCAHTGAASTNATNVIGNLISLILIADMEALVLPQVINLMHPQED